MLVVGSATDHPFRRELFVKREIFRIFSSHLHKVATKADDKNPRSYDRAALTCKACSSFLASPCKLERVVLRLSLPSSNPRLLLLPFFSLFFCSCLFYAAPVSMKFALFLVATLSPLPRMQFPCIFALFFTRYIFPSCHRLAGYSTRDTAGTKKPTSRQFLIAACLARE